MCNSNGASEKSTNEGRSIDEGFHHLLDAMYNDLPAELNSQTKRNPKMTRSIRSIELPRPMAFSGRYVTKVLHASPMVVSKRMVKPQMLGDNYGQGSDQDRLLRKLFCVPLLSKIVLLITPMGSNSNINDMFNIHAYMIEDQFHLGVTSLTASERELFVRPQKPNNYSLICCSGYIHLEDAFMNASLKKNIFRMSKNKSNAVVEIKCKGRRLSLQYTGDPHQPKIEAASSAKSRQVKIAACNATAEREQLEIVDNQIEELSEANANSVEQPEPLAHIVHPSIQQNIDNFEQIVEQQSATEAKLHIMNKVEHKKELSPTEAELHSIENVQHNEELLPTKMEDKQINSSTILQIEASTKLQTNMTEELMTAEPELAAMPIEESAEQLSNKVEQVPQEEEKNINASIEKAELPIIQPLANIVAPNIQQNIDNFEQIVELPEQQTATETQLQSTNNVEHNEKLPPTEAVLHSIENVEQMMKDMSQQLLSSSTILQIEASSEMRTIMAEEAQEKEEENNASVEQVEDTIIQEGNMEMSDLHLNKVELISQELSSDAVSKHIEEPSQQQLNDAEILYEEDVQKKSTESSQHINNSKIEKQKNNINKLLSSEAKKALIRDSLKWNPIDMKKPPQEISKTVKNSPTLQTFNKLHKKMLKQFQINRRLRAFQNEQTENEQSSKRKKQSKVKRQLEKPIFPQSNENLDRLMKSSDINLLTVEESQEKSRDELPQEVTCNCSLEIDRYEPCKVENIQKITDSRQIVESLEQHFNELEPREEMQDYKYTKKQSNDVSELLQDELKDIKDVPIEDVREVKEVKKQVTYSVKKTSTQNFNKAHKEKLKQFQIDRLLKKSLQNQQAVNEANHSSLFEEQQFNNRPVYLRSITSCSQYSYRRRCSSRIFSQSKPDKMVSSGGTRGVLVKQNRSSCKSLVTETRKPQWVTAGLNSKHRNYVVIHKPKEVITLKALKENYESDMSSSGDGLPSQNNVLVLYNQEDDDFDPNCCYELWPPQLLESESEGWIDESTIDCLIPNSQTILDASSTQFERMMQHPVVVPKTFSHRARKLIEGKLSSVDAKQAFHNLGCLIRRVNSRPIPHERHLQILFRLFARLDVQLFVRAEFNLPGCDPTPTMPRCRIECYFFQDRSDFIVSMAVLRSQLEQIMRQIPEILPNLHYCRDAFDLTRVPDVVRNYMRSHFNKLLKDLLAEYCYQLIQEKTPITAMPYVPTDHDILDDDVFLRPKVTKFLPLALEEFN